MLEPDPASIAGEPATEHARWRSVLALVRPHQWSKNLLLFLPLMTAHRYSDRGDFEAELLACAAFCLAASSVYVLNDLFDVAEDRRHPRKRLRPFAAGHLPRTFGLWLAPILMLAAVLISLALPLLFSATLLLYLLATSAYSLRLKRIPVLDVLVLASLYTLRLVAGAAAIAVPASFWLLAFSIFLFSSLALLKRYTELRLFNADGAAADQRVRGYRFDDMPLLATLGVSAGFLAVLVLALYVNSPTVAHEYQHGAVLWLMCPLLMYWIARAWLIAHRGAMHDDPVVYALTDRVSLLLGTAMIALLWFAL